MKHVDNINTEANMVVPPPALDPAALLMQLREQNRRLFEMEKKLHELSHFREKFLEWMGQYSRRFEDVRLFKEQTGHTLETVSSKVDDLERNVHLLKAVVSDVDNRFEGIQRNTKPGFIQERNIAS